MHPPPHHLGLILKLESQSSPLQLYSYARFPGVKQFWSVGWYLLATEDEEMGNIRLHELVKGQPFADLLVKLDHTLTKALVLINTEDNYEVAEEFVSGVREVPFPLLVVKRADGKEILRCLEHYNVREFIHATVVYQPAQSKPKSEHQPGILSGIARYVKTKITGHSKEVADLIAEIQGVMFSSTNAPVFMTEDKERFTQLMYAFHNYESTVSGWGILG